MENVGYDPDTIVGSSHTEKYNHAIGTQKNAKIACPDCYKAFHVYALEWEEDEYRLYVDDQLYFKILSYWWIDLKDKHLWKFWKVSGNDLEIVLISVFYSLIRKNNSFIAKLWFFLQSKTTLQEKILFMTRLFHLKMRRNLKWHD